MLKQIHEIIIIILQLFVITTSIAQSTSLSQNYNYYIYKSSNDQFFIGSLDGLNIYNGRENKIFRPPSSNMLGSNIQSEFYEDINGDIWFTTYEALHHYDIFSDEINYFQFKDTNNDIIDSDYRVINQSGDTIWVLAGEMTFIYNTKFKITLKKFCSEISDFHNFYVQKDKLGNHNIIACDAKGKGIEIITFDLDFHRISTKYLDDFITYGLTKIDDCNFITTSFNGDAMIFNHCDDTIIKRAIVDTSGIHKIEISNENHFIFYSIKSGVFKYDSDLENKIEIIFDPKRYGLQDKRIVEYEILNDNSLLLSILGDGIKPIYLDRSNKFENNFDELFYQKSIRNCMQFSKYKILLTSSIYGSVIYDLKESRVTKISDWENNSIDAIAKIGSEIIFTINDRLFQMDSSEVINEINVEGDFAFNRMSKIVGLGNRVLCLYDYNLVELFKEEGSEHFNWNFIKAFEHQNVTSVCAMNHSVGLVSINDQHVVKISLDEKMVYAVSNPIDVKGKVKDVHLVSDSLAYIATSGGLYIYNQFSNETSLISDNENYLNQTIYAIKSDLKGNLWLSSNSGILKYNPETEEVHQFTPKDGTQGFEYNTGAHLQTEDGHILFGGMHGLDYFHPDSITLSDYESPIYFSSFLVNEELYPKQTAQTLESVILPYDQNTLTFGFHAIDYTDPKNTLTKYKLVGKDNEYSKETSADGSARYSNLDPGDYTFTVMGANADHVWNPIPRTLHITILPPWYATWWARSLALLLFGGITYIIIKSYYKRQLREKDLKLREANIIISQQKVLSEERTRIAAEMHDDLGGGLTSIRFLSQKVLRTVTNEGLKTQVSKIVNLSEGLVNNMSEIIWAMDAGYDTLSSLISYVRRYAHEYLEDYDIDLSFKVDGKSAIGIPLSGNQRRNIFLVIKEAIHNTVKHSNTNKLEIQFTIGEDLLLTIKDDGIGLKEELGRGNGLKNMKRRIEGLGGEISLSKGEGLSISIRMPLK